MFTRDLLFAFLAINLFLISCQSEKEDPAPDETTLSLEIEVDPVLNGDPGISAEIDLAELRVDIIDPASEESIISFESAAELDGAIPVQPGTYQVQVSNGQIDEVGFDNPVFAGESSVFVIEEGNQEVIEIEVSQINARVNVNFDNAPQDVGFNLTVQSNAGSLEFDPDESRSGYFPAEGDITFNLGPEPYAFSETITSIQPADNYSIEVTFAEGQTPGVSLQEQPEDQTYLLIVNLEESDSGNSGASFNIWDGADVTFSKADGADPSEEENQDRLTDLVWLTRGNDGGQIYNAASETSASQNSSPAGTEWARGTTANIASLTFDDLRSTIRPRNIVGENLVLHLIEDDIYIDIQFTSWSTNRGGGFAYVRSSE